LDIDLKARKEISICRTAPEQRGGARTRIRS